jgi:DNA polymerase III delta prime subunit
MDTQFKPGNSYLVESLESISSFVEQTSHIDRSTLAPEITVKEVRDLLRIITERSFGLHRLLLIPNADQLSAIIQTTLLKVIEEPPTHLVIIVQTRNPDRLLATVRSRLHRSSRSVAPMATGASYKIEDLEGATREKAIEILTAIEREELSSEKINPAKLSLLTSAIQRLSLNCNVKLTIDWFLLRWQVVSGTE